jgi:hypothetical protein
MVYMKFVSHFLNSRIQKMSPSIANYNLWAPKPINDVVVHEFNRMCRNVSDSFREMEMDFFHIVNSLIHKWN